MNVYYLCPSISFDYSAPLGPQRLLKASNTGILFFFYTGIDADIRQLYLGILNYNLQFSKSIMMLIDSSLS
jgi:hypothetical protein